jgi:hypothetical protein
MARPQPGQRHHALAQLVCRYLVEHRHDVRPAHAGTGALQAKANWIGVGLRNGALRAVVPDVAVRRQFDDQVSTAIDDDGNVGIRTLKSSGLSGLRP